MRPSIVPRSFRLPLQFAAVLCAFVATGCGVLEPMLAPPPFDPFKVYLTDPTIKTIDTDYIDQYACPNNAPLMCQCYSRLHESCDCHC
jgi:hypothetical protein